MLLYFPLPLETKIDVFATMQTLLLPSRFPGEGGGALKP